MATRNGLRRTLEVVAGLVLLAVLAAPPAAAQAQPTKADKCNAYQLDEAKDRLTFKNSRFFVLLPSKQEREKLRTQGTPGQIFRMKECTPDLESLVEIYPEASSTGEPAETVPSAVRVVILAEKDDWIQVKGHTSLWRGTGWIRVDDNILVIKY